jgi:hypothetical protein
MDRLLDVVLLLALPASGKSEVRKYLAGVSPERCVSDFGMGQTVQLDDYPYVHLMRRIDDELARVGRERLFFQAADRPFQDPHEWGTLIELLNEDYDDLTRRPTERPASAAQWLFGRIDAAAAKAGARVKLGGLPPTDLDALAAAIETEAAGLHADKVAGYPDALDGKTVVVEFARGGADGSTMPLRPPFGYAHSLSMLSPALLSKASILYIWVTPEESRRKNYERTDPNDPGSILHHGVPIAVMLGDYGCDDMAWLIESSDRPDTVRVEAHGRAWRLPVARFDNRVDRTTFVRGPRDAWKPADEAALHEGLKGAFARLAAAKRL